MINKFVVSFLINRGRMFVNEFTASEHFLTTAIAAAAAAAIVVVVVVVVSNLFISRVFVKFQLSVNSLLLLCCYLWIVFLLLHFAAFSFNPVHMSLMNTCLSFER